MPDAPRKPEFERESSPFTTADAAFCAEYAGASSSHAPHAKLWFAYNATLDRLHAAEAAIAAYVDAKTTPDLTRAERDERVFAAYAALKAFAATVKP